LGQPGGKLLTRPALVKAKRQLSLPFGEITLLCGQKKFVQDEIDERLDSTSMRA
jgi:hypothetical protein